MSLAVYVVSPARSSIHTFTQGSGKVRTKGYCIIFVWFLIQRIANVHVFQIKYEEETVYEWF